MDSERIKVAVVGAAGKMGQQVLRSLGSDRAFEIVAAVDRQHVGQDCQAIAGPEAPPLTIRERVGNTLDETRPDVLIDFTVASGAAEHAVSALKRKVAVVIGTSGISPDDLAYIRDACHEHETAAILVPNFAVGALLMVRFAEEAARWLPYAEIIEYHNAAKADAPSGTAIHTAEVIKSARGEARQASPSVEKVAGARGALYKGLRVHSVRLPGLVAHQEVVFGGDGEMLTIRHDSLDRESFMLGVKLAVREVRSMTGFTVGLEKVMFR